MENVLLEVRGILQKVEKKTYKDILSLRAKLDVRVIFVSPWLKMQLDRLPLKTPVQMHRGVQSFAQQGIDVQERPYLQGKKIVLLCQGKDGMFLVPLTVEGWGALAVLTGHEGVALGSWVS